MKQTFFVSLAIQKRPTTQMSVIILSCVEEDTEKQTIDIAVSSIVAVVISLFVSSVETAIWSGLHD